MKVYAALIVALLFSLHVKAQITMKIDLPPEIGFNAAQEFNVRIVKGAVTSFSKYQLEVPGGFEVTELESNGGTFSFGENKVKIIWALTPEEAEIKLKMFLKTPSAGGSYTLNQKYFYVENGEKKELEFDPFVFQLKENPASVENGYVGLKEYIPSAVPAGSTVDPSSLENKSPEELRMHARQLKKDSREAFKVGEHEVKKAQLRLSEAEKELKHASGIQNAEERKRAEAQALRNKDAAQTDLAVANKILVLAKSLEDNANDIERLNGTVADKSTGDSAAVAASNTPGSTSRKSEEEIEQLKAAFSNDNSPENTEQQTAPSRDEVVFRVQIGAFGNHPGLSAYHSLGKVSIVNESGLYKVLIGSYSTREEALKKRTQVIEKGFDAFIVTYKDGQRLR